MKLQVVGINHETAPVALRERLAIVSEAIPMALMHLQETCGLKEVVILSTCNRCELIAECQDMAILLHWLAQWQAVPEDLVRSHLYHHEGIDAVKHLLKVGAGLNSMILGEKEIFGQLKRAYEWAVECGTVGKYFYHLFPAIFSFAKHIRQKTAIDEKPISVAYAAVTLARQIFADLTALTVLLIGAGSTMELAARHLQEKGVRKIIVANRTLSKAENLARNFKGAAISLYALNEYLFEADIVLSATASPIPVLGKGLVESALHRRKHRPMLMVDVAIPRDIEPEVGSLDDVYLYNLDDLQKIVVNNLRARGDCAKEAALLVDLYGEHYMKQCQALDSVAVIKAYRNKMETIRDNALQQAKHMLYKGGSTEAVLESLARNLTNKLMHEPSVQIRQASYEGRRDLLETARILFDIEVMEQ